MQPNYCYRFTIKSITDGDTIKGHIDLGFGFWVSPPALASTIRLAGIDTPESRTRKRPHERILGKAAKKRLQEIIASAENLPGKRGETKKKIFIQTLKDESGKFGRTLATLFVNNVDVNQTLIDEGHAREYWGGGKNELGPWTREVDGKWQRWTKSGYVPME